MLYSLENVLLKRQKGDASFELRIGSLSVGHSEFNFIVGESGCGKSTLMDGLGLLLAPSRAGRFLFTPVAGGPEFDVAGYAAGPRQRLRRGYLGFVLQSGGLIGSLSVRDNIQLSADLAGRKTEPGRLNGLAARLGIEDCLGRKPGALSGGQRQRVAIARAVLHRPPLILADEPTAAVDQSRAHEICTIFKELAKDAGCTTLMVTHNAELASTFGDRTLSLGRPRTEGSSTVSEINW